MDRIDFAGVDAELSDEERAVRESVARVVDAEALPLISECFAESRFTD